MRCPLLAVLLFISIPALAQNDASPQSASQEKNAVISNIVMEGFVLGNKDQFVKLFKPYRNKRLSIADKDLMLQAIQEIYEQAGYQGLVSIEYSVKKGELIFTVALIK